MSHDDDDGHIPMKYEEPPKRAADYIPNRISRSRGFKSALDELVSILSFDWFMDIDAEGDWRSFCPICQAADDQTLQVRASADFPGCVVATCSRCGDVTAEVLEQLGMDVAAGEPELICSCPL